ncbi:hypothetical protein Ancab_004922 [Ancistrocladus abbreviatus]
MAMIMGRSKYGYRKMEKEDPEEKRHRQAQFLIYKTSQQADQISLRRRPSRLRLRISKLRIKVGRRLKRLRKGMPLSMSKTWRSVFHGGSTGGAATAHLPQPLFS